MKKIDFLRNSGKHQSGKFSTYSTHFEEFDRISFIIFRAVIAGGKNRET